MRKVGVGQMIRRARERAGMSVKAAARIAGVTPAYYSQMECEAHAYISEDVADRLVRRMKAPKSLIRLRERVNERTRRYFKKYRQAA